MIKNYTGKSLDELLQQVAHEKDVLMDDLVYKVTEEKKGILGLGSSVSADIWCFVDVMDFIRDYLAQFFINIDLGADIDVSYDQRSYYVNINADNNAMLIGHNGNSLLALTQLIRAVTNAEFKHRFFINVDINNYKQDRYRKVRGLAIREAKNVLKTKIDVTLDPMPSDERRAIHQVLSDWDNIQTQSSGEGRERRLVIKYVENKEEELV